MYASPPQYAPAPFDLESGVQVTCAITLKIVQIWRVATAINAEHCVTSPDVCTHITL